MILIVDDEPHIRSSLSGLLEDEGYRVKAVESAVKAEEFLSSQPVELILLDIQMPGKDGLTFLDDNRERLTDIPVIIISGRGISLPPWRRSSWAVMTISKSHYCRSGSY